MMCWRKAGIPGVNAAAAILAAVTAPSGSTGPVVLSPIDGCGLIWPDWNGGDESFCWAVNNDRFSLQWFSNNECWATGNAGVDGGIWGGEGDEGSEPTELGLEQILFWKGNREWPLKLLDDIVACCCCCWRFLATTAAAIWWLTFVALLKDDMNVSKAGGKKLWIYFFLNVVSCLRFIHHSKF